VLVHGLACHRGFLPDQLEHFAAGHRVVNVDLRGHGDSDAPQQTYEMALLASDVGWICDQLGLEQPVLVGHSLGGLVALELAAARGARVGGVVLVDSVLLPPGDRVGFVHQLVGELRGEAGHGALRAYYANFFGPFDDPELRAWILEQTDRTPLHVTSSILEQTVDAWDDAETLARCRVPLLYLDAGTLNADLARASELAPQLLIGRTIGSGHFSPTMVPEQVNAIIGRFLAVGMRAR
jgi:pimeloyl-ACP methyl ester carboxylesterase